jgi:hypothetical protein
MLLTPNPFTHSLTLQSKGSPLPAGERAHAATARPRP